jgi:diguanylate cyclase (GGDEF)-like protein
VEQDHQQHGSGNAPATTPPPHGNGNEAVMSAPADGRRTGRGLRLTNPRDWALWSQPHSVVVYHLVLDTVVVAGLIYVAVTMTAPGDLDWFRFAALTVCATIHIQLSRRQEERRRNRKIKPQVYVDLTGVWSVPAVLVLPIQLALLLIAISRLQRWFVARRQPHRFTFAAASMLLAAMLAHAVIVAFGPGQWSSLSAVDSMREFGILLLAGAVYGAVQAGNIGGVLAMASQEPTLGAVLGTKEDNELEAITIALGIVSAILLVNMPAALVIMIFISVLANRIAEIRQLQVDVRLDPKTGLLNIRAWSEAAGREINRASRGNMPVALLMIDLDHFKSINDTWGHPAGDDVLAQVADGLRGETRPTDLVGRFGGEEFVVLLPDADTENAYAAAERIRRRISALEVVTTDKRGGPVTITHRTTSVGLAVYPHDANALDQLMQAADAAVYEAKEHGRNQVRPLPGKLGNSTSTMHSMDISSDGTTTSNNGKGGANSGNAADGHGRNEVER